MTEEIASPAVKAAEAKKLPFWIDFGPLLVFFVAFHYFKRENPDEALIWAAGVLAAAAVAALLYAWLKFKHNFKVFGFFPITLLFTLCQIPFLQKHATMK